MKRIVSLMLCIGLLLTLCACGRKKKEESGVIRIGVLEPRSGALSERGQRELLGVHYANTAMPTLQLKGKQYKIELVIADNEPTEEKSAAAAAGLASADCAAVIGSYGDALSAAASDAFLQAGMPAIAASCGDPELTAGNDHYFRISCLPEQLSAAAARFAAD